MSVKEYYQGETFRPAAVLESKLSDYCETSLYVLLKDGGFVRGEDPSTTLTDQSNIQDEFDDQFIESIAA